MAAGAREGVVTASVIGVPAPGVVVWRAVGADPVDGVEVAGDLDDPDRTLRPGDALVLRVRRDRFRWEVEEVVERHSHAIVIGRVLDMQLSPRGARVEIV